MKRHVIGVLLFVIGASPASAASWVGDMFVKTATASCLSNGIEVNSYYRSFLRPTSSADTPNPVFSLIAAKSAHYYELPQGFNWYSSAGAYTGVAITSTGESKQWKATFSGAVKNPSPHSLTSPALVIRITLANFGGIPNCEATLMGTLGLRPGG